MPIIEDSSYKRAPFYLFNRHLQTIAPSKIRQVKDVPYTRERLELPDGDFIDLDWVLQDKKKLAIFTHGLEGHSNRTYVLGGANAFLKKGWSVLAWNCRSCSGEMNRLLRLYHHGDSDDLRMVVNHVKKVHDFSEIALVGYSMGGSINLKYIGEEAASIASNICASVNISPPCRIDRSVEAIDKKSSFLYKRSFLKKLRKKFEAKALQYPGVIDVRKLDQIESWEQLDEWFSCPINGFRNTKELYEHISCINYMHGISIPTLIINALNDPICPPACNPYKLAKSNHLITLETPKIGGHVGFSKQNLTDSWMDSRATGFVETVLGS